MTSLRVLLLGSYLPPRGGAEAHLAQVGELLQQAGHAVEVWAPEPEQPGWSSLRDRVHAPAVARHVAERLVAFRPDVVHVHNFLRRLSTAPFALAARARVPAVLTVHDYQLTCPRTWALRSDSAPCPQPSLPLCLFGNCRGGLHGVAGRAVYAANTLRIGLAARIVRRRAARVLAPSQALALRLCRVLQREVAHVPYPFPPLASFRAPATSRLLFLGRVAAEKGPLELLQALAAARRSGAALELTVAGDGPLLDTVRARIEGLGLGDVVRCTGWVDASAVPALLAAHGALCVPSVWLENSPLAVHEALAAGRPVLGSTRGGIGELVDDSRSGLLFDPLDGAAFTAALLRWAALDDSSRAAFAHAARERAAAAGGSDAFLRRLLAEYAAALAVARRP